MRCNKADRRNKKCNSDDDNDVWRKQINRWGGTGNTTFFCVELFIRNFVENYNIAFSFSRGQTIKLTWKYTKMLNKFSIFQCSRYFFSAIFRVSLSLGSCPHLSLQQMVHDGCLFPNRLRTQILWNMWPQGKPHRLMQSPFIVLSSLTHEAPPLHFLFDGDTASVSKDKRLTFSSANIKWQMKHVMLKCC